MADCFLMKSGSGNNVINSFDYTNITGYYDITSLDLTNSQWSDILNNANFTLTGGTIDDNALKLSEGEWGKVVCDSPSVIYIVVKKPIHESSECVIISTAVSNKEQYGGLSLWQYFPDKNNYMYNMSAIGTPTVCVTVNDINNYHVFALAKFTNVNSKNVQGLMSFVDGEFKGMLYNTINDYQGFITLNCLWQGEYHKAYKNTEDIYIRTIVLGDTQTVEQVIENSKYLYSKYCV